MDQFDARRPGALGHGGTFNGNPVAAAAGLATLRDLTPDRYARLDELGDRLRTRLADALARRSGVDARVDGIASLFQVFPGPTLDASDGLTAARRCSSGCWSTASTSRRAAWARSRRRPTRPMSTTLADAIAGRLAAMQAVTAG